MNKNLFRIIIAVVTFSLGIAAVYFGLIENKATFTDISAIENEVPPIKMAERSEIDEDYAVYSAILNDEQFKSKIVVISDFTSKSLLADSVRLNNEISNLTQDTIEDFENENERTQKLTDNFTNDAKIIFLNEQEKSKIFNETQDGWKIFYKKYPKAIGFINFSGIGFNKENTQALVYVGIGCGWLCGEGQFIFLQKENDKWTVSRKIGLWVS